MDFEKKVIAIGHTGSGKSTLLNAILGLSEANGFEEGDCADAVTNSTSIKKGNWNGSPYSAIDTPGLDDPAGLDAEHIKQMVDFIKRTGQIQAILITINVRAPRFDANLKRMVRLYLSMLNTPKFWNNVALVFTLCYKTHAFNKKKKTEEFTKKMLEIFQESYPTESNMPQIRCFFVDSKS